MHRCKDFRTFKERGEWVELRFMTQAIEHGFKVPRPWGDSSAYDVGVESRSRVLKVQVKSTDCRTEFGYLCQFKPGPGTEPYTPEQVDFFAAYVIPRDVWYLIPAMVLLGGQQKKALTLLPSKPRHPDRYRYELSGGLDAAGPDPQQEHGLRPTGDRRSTGPHKTKGKKK
jgi:hypothetical protein